MIELAFDDIAALSAEISDAFGPWGETCELTQSMIDTFAQLTTDKQWIHVDPERAKSGPFGATIAHGFLVLSLMPAVLPPLCYRLKGFSAAINYGIRDLRFLQPVTAGSRIHARSRLQAVTAHRRGTLLTQGVEIQRVDADRPAVAMSLELLYV